MTIKRWVSVFGVFMLNLSVLAANTWYVAKEDPNAADTAVAGRGSEALPFRTIQAALDNTSFLAGDTVYVKRGDYDEGMKISSGSWAMTNRVWIAKTVHLVGVDGKGVTSIVGYASPDDETGDGLGPDSIRCVGISAAATGTVIENFTFRNGRTTRTSSSNRAYRQGGGVYYAGTDRGVKVIGCDFRDCRGAYGGAGYGLVAIRCLVDDCRGTVGAAFDGGVVYACVIANCSRYVSIYSSYEAILAASAIDLSVVNCTIFGNKTMQLFQTSGKGQATTVANCVIVKNANEDAKAATITDSTTSAVAEGVYQLFAPKFEDYRLVENATAISLGKVANVMKLRDLGVDADYLNKDYLGNAVDLTKDTLNAGAVQSVAVAATSRLVFADPAVVDGRTLEAGDWIASDKFPVQYRVTPIVPEGKTFYRFNRTKTGSFDGDREPTSEYALMDGSVRIVPPPAEILSQQTYTAVYAADEEWVDAAAQDSGTGTSEAPFATIQEAIDAVTVDYTLIHVRPGDYKTGGHVWSNLTVRVDFLSTQSGKSILVRADEGPAVTAIWGAAGATVDEALPGCGEGAARCVLGTPTAVVQGFTLRDGHTRAASEGTIYNTYGAATYQNANNFAQRFRLLDCVITNCVAADSVSYWTHTQRCRFVDNSTAGAILRRGAHFADLIYGNTCAGDYLIVDAPYVYFCTCAENASATGTAPACWANGTHIYNSIFVGGAVTRGTDGVGNVVWTTSSTGSLDENSKKADPCMVDVAHDDCRPYCWSTALRWSQDASTFYYFGGADLVGGSLAFGEHGELSSGCYQSSLPSSAFFADRAGNIQTNAVEIGGILTRTIPSTTSPNWNRGSVVLLDGYEFDVEWTGANSTCEFAAQVEGTGILTVRLNGKTLATVSSSSGKTPFAFDPSESDDRLRFVFTGRGSAWLGDFKTKSGLLVIFK